MSAPSFVRQRLAIALAAQLVAACAGDAANLGRNVPCDGGVRCEPRTGAGAAVCVDLERDPAHCGACDSPCAEREQCRGGVCVRQRCEPGVARCEGDDVLRCQSDGLSERRERCPRGERCAAGACALPPVAWPTSWTRVAQWRPGDDPSAWQHTNGLCGASGPTEPVDGARYWDMTSDWGAVWRELPPIEGFVAVTVRFRLQRESADAQSEAGVLAFAAPTGSNITERGELALGIREDVVNSSYWDRREPPMAPAPSDGWVTARFEVSAERTRGRVRFGDAVLYERSLRASYLGNALVFRGSGRACGVAHLRIDAVQLERGSP